MGEKATEQTLFEWLSNLCGFKAPVDVSQTRKAWSEFWRKFLDPDASNWPSGEKATDVTISEWP